MGVNLCDPIVIKCSRLYNCFHKTNLWVYFPVEINLNHTPKTGVTVLFLLLSELNIFYYKLVLYSIFTLLLFVIYLLM